MQDSIIFCTTDDPYPRLPLAIQPKPTQWWLSCVDATGEMIWQQQALNEDELVELINDAVSNGLKVEVESC